MFYVSCQDNKGDLLHTGLNSRSLKECIDDMWNYHISSGDEDLKVENPLEYKQEILESWGYSFIEHLDKKELNDYDI